jgi:hypothetical protein
MQRYPEDFLYPPVVPPAVQQVLGRLALRAKTPRPLGPFRPYYSARGATARDRHLCIARMRLSR